MAPFSSVVEFVGDFFEENKTLRLKAVAGASTPVEAGYELVEDASDNARRHDALALSWRPVWKIFPRFNGYVSVRPDAAGSRLAIVGSYTPPGGILGATFDRFIGNKLAAGTIDHLLSRITAYVEKRQRAYAAAMPTISELSRRP